jgi:hypothetical protein
MSTWQLSPQVENKVSEFQFWSKSGSILIRRENFAYAMFEHVSDSDTQPNIDLVNAQGLEVTQGTQERWDLMALDPRNGGPWVSWIFPDSMSATERDRITGLIDIGLYRALEEDGWAQDKTEYWFQGPLTLKEIA